nr:MAG: hypothetical protein A2W98_05555 [Bacteroidetes bacterium GWF2_33_38]OFY91744.1 MAG: hypothetical protein A2236_05885 [Bacteroidetes bacterium RIFOXYA2_FULL_33_7]HBF87460.1 efflux RND transporter periplasmic adaptor subunit [Bacteroidales bacterium]
MNFTNLMNFKLKNMKLKLLAVLISILAISCGKNNNQKSTSENENTGTAVTILEVKKDTFNHFIEVQGKVDGDQNVVANPKTPGVITQIFVNVGDHVSSGQVLAQLDDQILAQTMKELKVSLEFLTEIYNKQKNLWDQKIGSEIQYLSAKNNKESLENKLKTLQEQLDMYKITSPINGTIEEIGVKIGQMVSPGLMVPFRVINFSKIKVVADVSEGYSDKIKKGNELIIKFPDINREVKAKVDFASRYINPVNRTFLIEAYLNPSEMEYRANMLATIQIKDYVSTEVYKLPINLILSSETEKYVFVAKKEANGWLAKKQTVKIGQTYNGICEVTSGLEDGDKVLTSGLLEIEDGDLVKL